MAGFGGIGFCCCGDGGDPQPGDCRIPCGEDCTIPEAVLVTLPELTDGFYYDPPAVLAIPLPPSMSLGCCTYRGYTFFKHETNPTVHNFYFINYNRCRGSAGYINFQGHETWSGGPLAGDYPEIPCNADDPEEGDVEPVCVECECDPPLPDLYSITLTVTLPEDTFDVCSPITHCRSEVVSYSGTVNGCEDTDLRFSLKCEEDNNEHSWAIEIADETTQDSQSFPITLDESFSGSTGGTLTLLCGDPVPVTLDVSASACPVCDPVFTERGAVKLFGTLGGANLEVCLFGPSGLSYTGAWTGGILQLEGGPCDGANLLFEIYCKDLGGGASEWTLKITNDVESAELPIEWFDPLSAQGDVSGPVDLCGETGLAFAATIAMFTEADDPGHPAMRCCNPDIIQQCDLPTSLMADATPVPSQFDPCSVSNCDGIVRTMPLVDTPLECNGNPIGLNGYSSGDKYFISDFPATTHPVAGADAFNGHKLLIWCDGTDMLWARLDGDGCVHLNETGGFTTWDCESFSGTIEYNFDGSQDCCDGFGLSQWVVQVAPNL